MTKVISQRELRNENGAVLREVIESGETFIITRNGVPSAELRPVRRRPTFAGRDAFVQGRRYGSTRPGRHAELVADLDEIVDTGIEQR